MAVVSVIAATAALSMNRVRRNARIEQAKADIEILAAGIQQLAWDTGKWPSGRARNSTQNREVWDLSLPSAGLVDTDGKYPNWKGPYVPRIPTDPWGSKYFFDPDYRVESLDRVTVGSFGPNRKGPNYYDGDNIYVILL